MQKRLISLVCIASLQQLTACSSSEERANAPTSSFLESIPIVHRPDIQQGNIVTQEMVDQLQPGMSRRQVRFLLGTPMLVDVFHQNRWDYVYTLTEGWGDMEETRLSLYFEADQLMRVEGDMRPQPGAADAVLEQENVVSVPDYDGRDKGFVTRSIETVGDLIWSDDTLKTGPETEAEMAAEEEAEATKIIKEEEETEQQRTE